MLAALDILAWSPNVVTGEWTRQTIIILSFIGSLWKYARSPDTYSSPSTQKKTEVSLQNQVVASTSNRIASTTSN